jgi:anti-sigma factor ChrR (cupin superfamily)
MQACPSEEQLAAYVAGVAADPVSSGIDRHLSECGNCTTWIEEAQQNDDYLVELRAAVEAPDAGAVGSGQAVGREPSPAGYEILRRLGRPS